MSTDQVLYRGSGRSFSAGHDLSVLTSGESLTETALQAKVIERLGQPSTAADQRV
jgi:enoyl-CoA hydratase/carnithine racemase